MKHRIYTLLMAGAVLLLALHTGMVTSYAQQNSETPTATAEQTLPPAEETPTPEEISSSPTPAATETLPAETPTPEPTPAISDETAIRDALTAAIQGSQEEVLALLIYTVQIDHITFSADRNLALVWLAFADPESGEILATEPGLAIARRGTDGAWQMTLQADAAWSSTLNALPAELLPESDKALLQPPSAEELQAQAGQVFTGYRLPWAPGLAKRVSGSIGHVLTYKSCPTTCMYAFDFADGTMFPIMAARGGRVKYAVWQYADGNETNANYIVLEDTSTVPTTYQVYYHLAQNSIPAALRQIGAVVRQGDFIGNADDTGYSTGHHLHFHVYTTPNTTWGTSVDITFEDVTINGGRPRTCSEAATYPEYGTQCMPNNLLISGNTGQGGAVPAAPNLTNPAGLIEQIHPAFEWTAVSGASQYNLQVLSSAAAPFIDVAVNAAEVCQAGVCSYTSTIPLKEGSYQFQVRAANAYGWGAFSAKTSFTAQVLPAAPALIAPAGTIRTNSPTYYWQPTARASQYYLKIFSVSENKNIIYRILPASDVCSDSLCSYVSTVSLGQRAYRMSVAGGNEAGWGPFSAAQDFNAVLTPDAPALVSPTGRINTPAPAYVWMAQPNATQYYLNVYSLLTRRSVIYRTLSAATVCSGNLCSYVSSVTLLHGPYQFTIKAGNSFGWGAYAAWHPFDADLAPAVPAAVSPGNTQYVSRPIYTWQEIGGATRYTLKITSTVSGATAATSVVNTSSTLCSGGYCSYKPAISLRAGSYRLQVRSGNLYGWSEYGSGSDFAVQLIPPVPVLNTPNGAINTISPAYTWAASPAASQYYLMVYSPAEGKYVIYRTLYASAVCNSAGVCSYVSSVSLRNGYSYRFKVRAGNAYGWSAYSPEQDFNVTP